MDQSIRTGSRHVKHSPHCSARFASDEDEIRYPYSLRWVCTRCANSCRDLPGRERNILLAPNDLRRITSATRLAAQEYSLPSRGTVPYSRKMKKQKGRCIFLQDSRCSIYAARPLICRYYPFSLHPSGDNVFEVGYDSRCSGIGKGPNRGERFFRNLIAFAKKELDSK